MHSRTQKNVGVIGLGIIGQRVADNLRKRGFHVFVWNRTPRPFPNFVGSPAELAALCDFVQIFVSDDEALLQMVEQMKRELGAHHVVLAHSTVAPDTMRSAAEIVQRRGAEFLDAPFTGSKMAAEKGELVYYVAGDEVALRRTRTVLEASSKDIVEIGAIGDATTLKIATNLVTAVSVQVAVEALAIADRAGIPHEKFSAALRANASYSGTLGLKLPKIIAGDFEPHFSLKHMLKDVRIAARLARNMDLNLPTTDAAKERLEVEDREGRGENDYSSVALQYFPEGGLQQAALTAEQQLELPAEAAPVAEAPRSEPDDEEASEKPSQLEDDGTTEDDADAGTVVPAQAREKSAHESRASDEAESNEQSPESIVAEEAGASRGEAERAGDNGDAAPDRAELKMPAAAIRAETPVRRLLARILRRGAKE